MEKAWKDNNMLLRENLDNDYSNIPEVKALNYVVRGNGYSMPGINNIKQFVKALEDTGYDEFKIRTSRCPISNEDLKDSWLDLKKLGWGGSKTWDTSLSGFNEIFLFSRI